MDKTLTISIAAYNVEKYIENTLKHLIDSEVMDDLEVFVVDDGGTDRTYSIVEAYQKQYPGSIHLIHKENGGYGSTVNWSVKHATGKYFKLLDGDDWFDSENLKDYITFLKNNDADCVLSKMIKVTEEGTVIERPRPWKIYDDQILSINSIEQPFVFGMWELTYKTKIIQSHFRDFPEHTLYTDCLYVCYPLPYVQTIGFYSKTIYNYRVGIDGQSVSKESRIKNCDQHLKVYRLLQNYYYEKKGDERFSPLVKHRFVTYYRWALFNILLLPKSKENYKRFMDFDRHTFYEAKSFWEMAGRESKKIRLIRYLKYTGYQIVMKFGVKNWS